MTLFTRLRKAFFHFKRWFNEQEQDRKMILLIAIILIILNIYAR